MKNWKKRVRICLMALVLLFGQVSVIGMVAGPVQVQAATVGLNKSKLVLDKGKSYQLKLSGARKVTWRSNSKSIAVVSSTGKVTAKRAGKAVITARTGNKTYRCQVTVESPSISKKSVKLVEGQTVTIKMKNTIRKVTWSTKNKSIATVSKKGVVAGKKSGTTTITAKVGTKKYTCKVVVRKKSNASDSVKNEVVRLMNQERQKAGLPLIKMDDTLNAAADVRAREISEVFSHTRPDGTLCFSILSEPKYSGIYWSMGENIAAGYSSAGEVMTGWMNSPGHKANILDESFNKVGIGIYYDSTKPYGYYWVQLFAQTN